MKKAEFTLYGKVIGKGRPRFTTVNGRVHTYTPPETKAYEEAIQQAYKVQCGDRFFYDVAIKVDIAVRIAPPKATNKGKYADMMCGAIKPTKKPDCDNVAKIVLDALNHVAYTDDKYVVYVSVIKEYAERDGITVTISQAI